MERGYCLIADGRVVPRKFEKSGVIWRRRRRGSSPPAFEAPGRFGDSANQKEFELGGVAVKLAGHGDILALLRRHSRCIGGARYAARAQPFPGDLVHQRCTPR